MITKFSFKASENQYIEWYYNSTDGKYYLFVPTMTDLSSLTIRFDSDGNVFADGEQVFSDKPTDAFIAEGEHYITCGRNTYPLIVMHSENIGAVFIKTESGNMDAVHADKDYKESGIVTVINKDGVTDYSGALDYIKGRGNATWIDFEKKPYCIKLGSESQLLGMQSAKNGVL